jgi:hypothetical protein
MMIQFNGHIFTPTHKISPDDDGDDDGSSDGDNDDGDSDGGFMQVSSRSMWLSSWPTSNFRALFSKGTNVRREA